MCNPVSTKFPEFLLAKGVHKGFEWEVTNNGLGYRCGYVRVPAGHPWHGRNYSDISPMVHGGLTFAEPDFHCGKGGPDDAWWLGFDCAHVGDAPDPSLPLRNNGDRWYEPVPVHDNTIKTTDYVAAQCRSLADQAKKAERKQA